MSSEPYLICHLVRGEPAFDIAIKMEVETDDEPWWIIPTSGHRAYPYATVELRMLVMAGWLNAGPYINGIGPPPEGWPDHYSTTAAPRGQGILTGLAEALGFAPKPIKIRRR